jgi:hypothetical protein
MCASDPDAGSDDEMLEYLETHSDDEMLECPSWAAFVEEYKLTNGAEWERRQAAKAELEKIRKAMVAAMAADYRKCYPGCELTDEQLKEELGRCLDEERQHQRTKAR